jgi:hypothetical protein
MDAGTLYTEITKVCPIVGTAVGVADDRATWRYDPKPEATQAEKDAADNVVATIPVDQVAPPPPAPEDVVLFDHENRLRSLEGQPALELAAFQEAKAKATVK